MREVQGGVTEATMRIGEVAHASGVSVRALRYYEEQGLLSSTRTAGGQRRYVDDAVERVGWIQRLFAAGLSSTTVRELLPYCDARASTPESRARLRDERDRLDAHVAQLMATRERLDVLISLGDAPNGSCAYVA